MSNILVGVTGGIAAYKTAYLVRYFIKKGHNVKVIMTRTAEKFIGHTTFEALTGNKVLREDFEPVPISHIEFASWADICVIAPATANFIGKLNAGIYDNELLSTCAALTCPLILAPAMNTHMYENITVQENIENLKRKNIYFIEPNSGLLACKTEGVGKMEEPEIIGEKVLNFINTGSFSSINVESDILSGLNILITAGPTREYIDPVRYITNKSSGKMGYALARESFKFGANVTLISGITDISTDIENVIKCETSKEMFDHVLSLYEKMDIIIMAAAVSDYTPKDYSEIKIKKHSEELNIELVKTIDILKYLGEHISSEQVLVGFAAETNNVEENALSKLKKKNADIICANDVSRSDIGFNSDNNEMTLYFKDGSNSQTGLQSKDDIAKIILTESAILLNMKKDANHNDISNIEEI